MTTITVYAKPVTQGSVTAIPVRRKSGKMGAVAIHNHSVELYEQRAIIQSEYRKAGGQYYETEAVEIEMVFSFIRPKSVKEKKRPYMTVKPDTDKCIRAVLDSLTNVAYKDDCQVVSIKAVKIYGEQEYTQIRLERYGETVPP